MTVLGIETATTVCAAAVVRDGEIRAEELVDQRNVHAERLMGMIDAVLAGSGTGLGEVNGIAVSIGPGSFTGLRIGLSVAKALAYAGTKKLVPVSTLQGLAMKAARAAGPNDGSELVLALLDARRGDAYNALYRIEGSRVVPVWEQRVMPLRDILGALPGSPVLVTGDARQALYDLARELAPDMLHRLHVLGDDAARCSAAVVALAGEERLRWGESVDPGLLEPEYLRDFVATRG